MDTKKRKTSRSFLQWKKRRRPHCDQSEFVSVEIGMIEFKKRLAATDGEEPIAPLTRTQEVIQDMKTETTRTKRQSDVVQYNMVGTKVKMEKRVPELLVKKQTRKKVNTKTKMTLDQVKAQLAREQQERVDNRIQMLYCEERMRAAVDVDAAVPFAVCCSKASAVITDGKSDRMTLDGIQKEIVSMENGSEAMTVSSFAAVPVLASADPVALNEPHLTTKRNDFIVDDLEEDLMFAMVLEETERQLVSTQNLPSISEAETSTDSNSSPPINRPVSVASYVPAKAAAVESQPDRSLTAIQQPMTTTVAQTTQTKEVMPEVMKELERLRREKKFLKWSNKLLQAARTSPVQAKTCGSPYKDNHAMSFDDCSVDTSAVASRNNFLDLARCDSDQKMRKRASLGHNRQHQQHSTDTCVTTSQSIPSETQSESIASNGKTSRCEDQCKLENGNESATESDIVTDHTSELSHEVFSRDIAATTPMSDHTAPSGVDIRLYTEPAVTVHKPVEENDTTSLQPVELSALAEVVIEDCVYARNVLDHNDVLDTSMAEVDEKVYANEEKEAYSVHDRVNGRMSTVDSGNYTEYRVQQMNDHSDVDDEYMNEVRDNNIVALTIARDVLVEASAHIDESSKMMVVDEPSATQKVGTPADSDIVDRTTAPSNSDTEDDEGKNECISLERAKRLEMIAQSSSSSESESDSEKDETSDTASLNVLEAALHAVGGHLGKKQGQPCVVVKSDASDKQDEPKDGPSAAVSGSSVLPISMESVAKKQKTLGMLSANAKAPVRNRSSLLWPVLDDFYDFLLNMSPRSVRGFDQKGVYLRQHAGRKLPTQYKSIEEYCGVQLEAVLEEVVASVSNIMDWRSGRDSRPACRLPLTSVSPCRVQNGLNSSTARLSFGAIFSESGFTGSMSSSNDYVLSFDTSALGKKSLFEILSGDLVLVRSPRWKNHEMYGFGVVLCDSVIATGGNRGWRGKGGGGGSRDGDQTYVLVRVHKRDQDDVIEDFSVLTELCLSNQRAPNWRWSLQHINNTTTSAREFQAIKAIAFYPNDLQQTLLRGRLTTSTTTQTLDHSVASSSVLSPLLLKYLRKHYNDSQVQAIVGCLGKDSTAIIQGPPGTGKTKTILGLLSALLDGAGMCTSQKAKGTARIRAGASLQSAQNPVMSKTVAEMSVRVLVTAPSNAAVDELIIRVLREGLFDGKKGESYRPQIVRVGRPDSNQHSLGLAATREASESKKSCKKTRKCAREVEEVLLESLLSSHRSAYSTVKQARQAIIKNAQIVFCTLSGAGSIAMCEFAQEFDALIIDEAAQAVEASTLIPFKFRPHRVILVGDHRQLSATVLSKKLVSMGYDRSLQQRLVENDSPVLLLTQQYRMHPEIASFPSSYFYGGRLVQDTNMREWTAQDYHRDPAFKPLLFYDVQGLQSQVSGSSSLRNMNEVEAVILLVHRLLRTYPQVEWRKRLGIIAPYKQQILELHGAIGKLETELNRHLGIEVNTVDGFQGREKEIIIYSCVRTSHSGRSKHKRKWNVGTNDTQEEALDAFWADERRLNVAITRAKSSLWILGNSTMLNQSRAWRALIQHLKDQQLYRNEI